MQRCFLPLAAMLALIVGCGEQKENKPAVVINVNQTDPKAPASMNGGAQTPDNTTASNSEPRTDENPKNRADEEPKNNPAAKGGPEPKAEPTSPKPASRDKYDAAVARAFQLLAQKDEEGAMAAFQEAHDVDPTPLVKGEIERLKGRLAEAETIDRTAQDIQAVLNAGDAAEASKLAADALAQFGGSDASEVLVKLKRQADALLAVQLQGQARKQRFIDDAEAARKAKNFRVALLSYDQAVAAEADVSKVKDTYEELRSRLEKYDELRSQAAELRKDPNRLEDAVAALEDARKAWETPEIVQAIEEVRIALQNRRDRLAVADFEVIGDVGIPLAGRAVAEELLPHFKGRYDLVERSQVAALLDELKLDAGELNVNAGGRSELGKLAKARYLVVGSVSRLYGLTVNARLIDTQSGLVVQTAKIVAGTPEEMSRKLQTLASILLMSDEEKIAHERQLAKAATIDPPPTTIPPPPPADAPPVEPIVASTPRPPEFGAIVVEDFQRFPAPAAQPQAVVIAANAAQRDRAVFAAVQLGDNLARRGRFVEAQRQFQFALALAPGRQEVRVRLANLQPRVPPPPVVVVPPRPRIAVMPFVEIGRVGFVPPGLGYWTAEALAPYYLGNFDVADLGEVYWWMGRLGLTLRDVIIDPSARLLLARAVGVRFFVFGNLVETASFNANVNVVDAEFNALVGVGSIHVRNPFEFKLRLGELAHQSMLPPAQQVVFVQQRVIVERRLEEARIHFGKGKFGLAITVYREVLVARPNDIDVQFALAEAERRQRLADIEAARIAALQAEQARIAAEQERRLALALAAQRQREAAERQAAARAEAERLAFLDQQQRAQGQLVIQARAALKAGNFAMAVNFFESAVAVRRTPDLSAELAAARAQAAEAERRRLAQQQAAREAALVEKQKRDAEAARQALLAEQKRRAQAEAERRKQEEAQAAARYNHLLDQAEKAKAKGQYEQAVSALQAARALKPSADIDRLIAAALVDLAKADAARKGAEERKRLEAQLAAEQEMRRQAEIKAAENQAKYEAAMKLARAARQGGKLNEAKQQYQAAIALLRTEEAVNGLRQVDDDIARAQAAAEAEQKAREAQKRKDAEFNRLLAEAREAANAKQFARSLQLLESAASLKPGNVEVQTLIVNTRQARDEHTAQQQLAKEKRDRDALFQKHLDAGRASLASRKYEDAIAALTEALKIRSNDPAALAALKEARAALAKTSEAGRMQEMFDAAMAAGKTAFDAGKYAEAVQQYTAALKIRPKSPMAEQGLTAARKALQAEQSAAMRKKAYDDAMTDARAALAAGKYAEAIASAGLALKQMPNDAQAAMLIKQAEKARAAAVAAENRKNYDAAVMRGRAALNAQRFPQAIEEFLQALKYVPNDPTASQLLAQARAAQAAKKDPPKKDPPKTDPPKKDPPKKDPPKTDPPKKDPPKKDPPKND